MCVRPSVRMGRQGSHCTDCRDIWYLSIFRKSVENIPLSLKSDRNDGTVPYCTWRPIDICDSIALNFCWTLKYFGQQLWRNPQHNFMLNNFLFYLKSCRFWDNVEKYGRAGHSTDDNIRPLRFACWITKATDTHSEYVILFAFPQQQWLYERASVVHLYFCCPSCWKYF